MDSFQNILICSVLILEVALLMYLEVKAWGSMYTPLNFLMVPYLLMLLLSISISGNLGFVEFYYPSILIWCCGLLIFALPSLTFAFILRRRQINFDMTLPNGEMPKLLVLLSGVIIILFALRLYMMMRGPYPIASEEFGENFAGRGFWGHLRQLALPLLIMAIYFLEKKRLWLWLIIIPIIIIAFLYQVKGWVIIPCLAGIALRVCTGKTKMKLSIILYVVLGAVSFFALSYVMTLTVGGDKELGEDVIFFIFRNVVHYLTSGVLGLSVDMQNGFPDAGEFDSLISQVLNILNVLSGSDEIVASLNQLFYNTGFNLTNVRSFFGTIFINSNYLSFFLLVLFISTCMYMLRIAVLKFRNVYIYTIYVFECGLLFMGWFDYYFGNLTALELPCLVLALWFVVELFGKRGKSESSEVV